MRRLDARYHRQFPDDRDRLARLLTSATRARCAPPTGSPSAAGCCARSATSSAWTVARRMSTTCSSSTPAPPASRTTWPRCPFNARNPLYAVLHEASYADGGRPAGPPTVRPDDFEGDSLLLTGEHLFAWNFEDAPRCGPTPRCARILAEHEWPRLYDARRARSVDVPCAAAIYADDPYVDRGSPRRPPGCCRHASVAHRPVPAQRAAHRRWPHPRPADRARPRAGLRTCPTWWTASTTSSVPPRHRHPDGRRLQVLRRPGRLPGRRLTYYAFIAIFPILLIASSVLGFVLQGHAELQQDILTPRWRSSRSSATSSAARRASRAARPPSSSARWPRCTASSVSARPRRTPSTSRGRSRATAGPTR